MRLIKPNFEIWDQQEGLEGVYKQIERAGRVCYKSEDKITETSAKDFVERMIKSGHGAMLEHGTVYLCLPPYSPITLYKYRDNKYSSYKEIRFSDVNSPKVYAYVSTNYRVLIQGDYNTWDEALANNFDKDWLDDLQYLCEPTEYHEKRTTVRFICDRGVSHEFVRHRVFSFAQESTRYCNYSKSKFNNECTFIIPSWCTYPEGCYLPTNSLQYGSYIWSLRQSEEAYFELLHNGWIAQQARAVLPNALKTELVMTGFISDWEHFFQLRCNKTAHPDARILAEPLQEEFYNKNILK